MNSAPSDVTLCVMPLFHVHGLVASMLSTLLSGGTVVVPAKFSPLSFWRIVRDTDATWYSAVPTIHQLVAHARGRETGPTGAEHLRFIRSCSAALPPGNDGEDGTSLRRAGARSLWHDRGFAPDVLESAAARRRANPARWGPARASRSASWTRPAISFRKGSAAKW